MDFERARKPEQKQIRINQIKEATLTIFESTPYHEITLAKIAGKLNFTRANLYKYIGSKEEIFLEIILDEINKLISDLENNENRLNKEDLLANAKIWADITEKHVLFLQLLSFMNTVLEQNASIEKLIHFKNRLAVSLKNYSKTISIFFPSLSEANRMTFLQMHNAFITGLYPNSNPSQMQRQASKDSSLDYKFPNFTEMLTQFIVFTVEGLTHQA